MQQQNSYSCFKKPNLKYPLVKIDNQSIPSNTPKQFEIFGFNKNSCCPNPHNPLNFQYSPNPSSIYHKHHKLTKSKGFHRRNCEKTQIFTLGLLHFKISWSFGSSRRINGDIILHNREISTREGKEMMKKMGARVCLCVFRWVGEIEGQRNREKGQPIKRERDINVK